MRILIVDDDSGIILALYRALSDLYKVDSASSAAAARQKLAIHRYDAIILDLNLPDDSGLQVCEQIRANGIATPILVLSGDDQPVSKVMMLDSGANDYLTKPFSIAELQARLRVLLRDMDGSLGGRHRLVVGDLTLDRIKRQVHRQGTKINLRKKEFAVLECLMQNSGMVVTRATLGNYAWEDAAEASTNTVDVHIKYLRDKIDRPFKVPLIHTVHGLGYKIDTSNSSTFIKNKGRAP